MKKGRILSALLSIFMMLVSNTLRADDVISQFRILGGSTWPEGGAMLIRLDKYDYLLAGSGVVVDFKTRTKKNQERQKQLGEDSFAEAGTASQSSVSKFTGSRLGLLSVDEVTIDHQGQMQFLRRHKRRPESSRPPRPHQRRRVENSAHSTIRIQIKQVQ